QSCARSMGSAQSKQLDTWKYDDFQIIRPFPQLPFGHESIVKLVEQPEVQLTMKSFPYKDESDKKAVENYVQMLNKTQSEYTLHFFGAFDHDDEKCLIFEHCSAGSLRDLIQTMKDLSLEERMKKLPRFLFHILSGLAYLHLKGIIHGNLKPEDIHIDKDRKMKIANYGFNVFRESISYNKTLESNEQQLIKELIQDKLNPSHDIYSLGIIAFLILTGSHPFKDQTSDESIFKDKLLTLPDQVGDEIKEMIVRMLNKDPTQRPFALELLDSEMMRTQANIEKEQQIQLFQKIKDDLQVPLIGSELEDKLIIQTQESGCELIISKLKDKKDDEGRKSAIFIGVTSELSNIFETRDLNLISPVYIDSFECLSFPSDSIDIRPLIFAKKNPYPGLIRLLQHQNDKVVLIAIKCIGSILIGSIDETEVNKLKKIHRASVDLSEIQIGRIKLKTIIKKNLKVTVNLTLRQMENQALCPIKWWIKWIKTKKKTLNENEVWLKSNQSEIMDIDRCSLNVRLVLKDAGIPENSRVTSIRAASITKAIQNGATVDEINRWTRHSSMANTIQRFYDKNNNDRLRGLLIL
ncbi:MAG: putative aurora kinase, partial [Streblomastix strix]